MVLLRRPASNIPIRHIMLQFPAIADLWGINRSLLSTSYASFCGEEYALLCLQISLQNIEEYLVTGPIHIIQCQVYCSSHSMFFVLFLEICNNQTQLTLMSCVNIWYRLQIAAWACNIFSQLVSIFHKFFQAFSTSELSTTCLNLIQLFNNF